MIDAITTPTPSSPLMAAILGILVIARIIDAVAA
jgi:hypothetical protein